MLFQNKLTSGNNFNRIAPVYDFLAQLVFGNSIRDSQQWLLKFIPEGSKILIIGGGSGWILKELLHSTNCKEILYLEASGKMLELSKKQYQKIKKPNGCQVEFRLGTEKDLLPTETFDIILTGFILDLFKPEPLWELMQRLNTALNRNGLWLVADFAPENDTGFRKKLLVKTMIKFFKLTANLQADSIPELKPLFDEMPLRHLKEDYFYRKLIRAAVYQKV